MMTEKLNSGHTNLTSKGFVYFIYLFIFGLQEANDIG